MSSSRVVFHCADQDLFELFIRGLSRKVLIDPLRNDKDLMARCFRGYRITKNRPDVAAISRAYYKEINSQRNNELVNYMCRNWVLAHGELATSTLKHLGLSSVDFRHGDAWLEQAHKSLEEKGHLDAASEITRTLAFDHPVEDILTILSILSVEFEQQSDLRQRIEHEFQTVHDDPGHLHAALVKQQTHLRGRLDAIDKKRSDENTRCKMELGPITNELTKLATKRGKLERERHVHEKAVQESKKQLDKAKNLYNSATASMQEWKSRYTKLESSITIAQQKLQQCEYSRDALLADLDKQKKLLESELSGTVIRLEAARKRMTHFTRESVSVGPAQKARHPGLHGGHSYELNDVLAFVDQAGFYASPVTLDILWMSLHGKLPAVNDPPRQRDYVVDPEASSKYYAHMAVHGPAPWAGEVLGKYALARSLHDGDGGVDTYDTRMEILFGGLYHSDRMSDSELVDQLLARLIEVLSGNGRFSNPRIDLSKNLDLLQECLSDASTIRRLGSVQAKLATANPRALQRFYDVMSPGIRIQAKRALVAQVKELGLPETEPTHEVLDVVTTHLERLVGQLTSGSRTWGEQATLRNDVRQRRQSLLAGAAKLAHVFSSDTDGRLTQFRDLLGHHLTQVLADDTLDGHEVFRRLLLEYCLRDCYQPEWISCRYLFPIVISLSHVASRADHAMRQRKAEIAIALEKQQHPLNTARRGVPLRIGLENTGVATATQVQLEIEADGQEVTVRPRDRNVAKIGPEQRVSCEVSMDIARPVSAVVLSCLFNWKDPNGVQRFGEETLKLTAQREVDWAGAGVNPYSLGSIRSQDRLVGRDDDLNALRVGIRGMQSFCITGQKRVGKTSIARVLRKEFQDSKEHLAIYITFGDRNVAKIGPEQRVSCEVSMDIARPVSAVVLSCLFNWKDPNGVQRFGEETLKLTAQREVDWAGAGVNPYSLGSIRSQDRLVGRDDDLNALRVGIRGMQSFCITGQKRVGKTSIARVLRKEFQDSKEHLAIYITFGDLVTTSWPALVHSLYEAINDELEEGARAELPPVEVFVGNQSRHSRVFLRELERKLDGRRVLCIIDDFDEIDERMYKGEEAKELFLRFRTLIDRGDFSFVLVGSEKLPDVMKYQGERLNQVRQQSLNYFRDRSSLQQLAADPARPYLEYSDDAVDEIWRYSAGNPYYATHICSSVYLDMVGRRDHYVGRADVQRSVEAICADSSVSTFQHFWTDGIFEGGRDTARRQYLNAALLSACAQCCGGEEEQYVERKTLVADSNLRMYDPEQVRFHLDNLVHRGVLLQKAERVRLRVPLFEKWLLAVGEAAVRSSFREEDLEVRLAPAVSGPEPREIVEIARDLHYQGEPVNEIKVNAWLKQFGFGENQKLALRLLEGVKKSGYYSEAKIHAECKALHGMMLQEFANEEEFAKVMERRRVSNVFVTHFEGEGRSGGRMLHAYRIANSLATNLVGSMEEAARFVTGQGKKERKCGVVFVDDFIGTGGSCAEGLRRFGERLEKIQGEMRNKLVVGVAALVGFKTGVETVRANGRVACHVVTTRELGAEDRAFAPEANIFDSDDDRIAAEKLCRDIGSVLEPKQPLGFGDNQALVCFHYRCPNNTLPVFYKDREIYQGQRWIPLFPR